MSPKSSNPRFSLIFLAWNAENVLPSTLKSLRNQDYSDYEILVVDNASSDDTVDIAKQAKQDLPIRVLENNENLGFSSGMNKGIQGARGDYMCCYNHDTRFPEDYLATLTQHVSDDAVYTTARLNHRTSETQRCIRLLGKSRFPIPYAVKGISGVAEVNYVPGDGAIIPKRVVEKRGMVFDPALPSRGEDVDFSLWLQNQDIPIKAILDTYSIHPDEGPYKPSFHTAFLHIENVYARFRAYHKHRLTTIDVILILLSGFYIPITILYGKFPRSSQKFKEQVSGEFTECH